MHHPSLTQSNAAIVSQTIGGAFLISAGQSSFTNILIQNLPSAAPTVDVSKVLVTGVTELRNHFSAEEMVGIISAYMDGLKVAYAVALTATGIALLVSFASKWRSLKGKQVVGAV